MGRVISNASTLQVVAETSLNTPGTAWDLMPWKSIGRFGAEVVTMESSPVSRNRRRQSAAVTDLNSGLDFEDDLRLSTLRRFLPGFLFATATAPGSTGVAVFSPTAAADGGVSEDSFTVSADGDLPDNTLIYARGFTNAANNGLFVTTGTSTATAIKVATATLVAEASPPSNARVEVAGVQGATADIQIDSDGNIIATALDFTTLDLVVGQYIWVGGTSAAATFAVAANRGFARIDAIAAGKLTVSHTSTTFSTDNGSGKTIQLFFGEFLRDVDTDDSEFLQQSYQFELAYPELASGPATMYEYSKGNYCNSLSLGIGLTSLITASYGFIGTDTPVPVAAGSRASGASTPYEQNQRQVFSTSIHDMRMRMIDVDESGLTTDFKTASFALNNNIVPEKVIGTLGAAYMNYGTFSVDVDATVIFSNADMATRVRENTIVEFDFAFRNADGAVHFGIPSARLGSGMRAFPINESVTMQTTIMAEEDETLGFSLGVSLFAYLPAS